MERQRVTKAIVNTAWLSTAHNVHPALVPHAFLPMFGLPIVSLISWGFRWSWCIWPSDICTDGSVTPHCPSPSQPCSSNSLSTHTIPYLCTFWVHKFWLESDGKLALSAAFFPQEQAGLMCPFSHGLSKLNIVWLTQTQVGIIPIWKKWNKHILLCVFLFLSLMTFSSQTQEIFISPDRKIVSWVLFWAVCIFNDWLLWLENVLSQY